MSFENEDRYIGFDPFKKLEEYEDKLNQFYRGMDLLFEDPERAMSLINDSLDSNLFSRKRRRMFEINEGDGGATISWYEVDGEPVSLSVGRRLEQIYGLENEGEETATEKDMDTS